LTFSAQNTFSAVSLYQEWHLLVAAYATGNLTANGSAGEDIIITGSGSDTAFGEEGNDILNTGDGDDTLIGGNGDDFYMVDSAGGVGRRRQRCGHVVGQLDARG
jgi:Ca2+-binding RTX toxin-like protein